LVTTCSLWWTCTAARRRPESLLHRIIRLARSRRHTIFTADATPNWLVQEQMHNAVRRWDDVVTEPLMLDQGAPLSRRQSASGSPKARR
jgi:hypothetical protein